MNPSRPEHPHPLLVNPRAWRWGAGACLITTALWLMGSWAALSGRWSLGYEVDVGATLLCAVVLLGFGLLATWRGWQLGVEEMQATHKLWLSVLLVRRDEAEQAAEAIDALCDALEALHRAWQPVSAQAPHALAADAARLDHISPDLQPLLSRQSDLTQHMKSLQARLVNLQVKFGRGEPLEALAYDLQPLSDEYRQLNATLNLLFNELQATDTSRRDQLQQYRQHLASQDPYAPWRSLLETALTQLEQARILLARSLDQTPSGRPAHIDQFLGLRP